MSVAAVILFGLTMVPDTLAAYNIIHLPAWFTMGGIDDARAILGAMLGCVSTVLALIFSVALLMLSMVATLFGPRLLYRFVQDWVTQATIGLFMAAFIYVFLVFLVTHQDAQSAFIPQVSLIVSWIIVLAAFAFLVFYSHRIAVSIQNPDAVARIVKDIRTAQRSLAFDFENSKRPHSPEAIQRHINEGGIVAAVASGYIQGINHAALIKAATDCDAVIYVLFRPGQFVLEGEPLARIWPASNLDQISNHIVRNIEVGRHRVLDQDIEFGIAQIVEIAIRALSPAINDTFTGIACVDCLGEALSDLAKNPRSDEFCYDSAGTPRLRVRPLLIERLVKQAFDQVRQAAVDNPAVQIRMLTTIERIAPLFNDLIDRQALAKQADAVWEAARSRNLAKIDLSDIESAWTQAATLLNCQPQANQTSA